MRNKITYYFCLALCWALRAPSVVILAAARALSAIFLGGAEVAAATVTVPFWVMSAMVRRLDARDAVKALNLAEPTDSLKNN